MANRSGIFTAFTRHYLIRQRGYGAGLRSSNNAFRRFRITFLATPPKRRNVKGVTDKTGFSTKSCNHPSNLWKPRYKQLYYDYQLNKYGASTLETTGYLQLKTYPNVNTHKGLEEAAGNIIKWSGGTVVDTPTTGTPRFEKKLVGGKLESVMVGYNRAKGGKGKQDHIWILQGQCYFIDYKVGADYQKEAQVKFQKRLERAGGIYMLIHNPNEVFEIVDGIISQKELF